MDQRVGFDWRVMDQQVGIDLRTLTSFHVDRARWGLLGHVVLVMGSLSHMAALS